MRMVDIIHKKRFGETLSKEEIRYFVSGCVSGEIPDYQLSAMLMAICFQGLSEEETAELTLAMTRSGDTVDLSSIPGIKVDKHSTGGVGDTTTLIVAPLVAACGAPVAKMSGRGLGHSGGTLDKLEAFPGVNILQPIERFLEIVRQNGLAVVGQTGNLVPADRILYALRDVTGTVESMPLIASSVMSKKLAAGADAIVLDVKVGSGAFMQTLEEALALAETMTKIGSQLGRQTVAILTDMNQPLGMAVGNGLESEEAIDALSGRLPEDDPLLQVSFLLGRQMLQLAKVAKSDAQAQQMLEDALRSGAGKAKLRQMIEALGGDGGCVDDTSRMPKARRKQEISSPNAGYICGMRANLIGEAALLLGAGRNAKEDTIDPAVGLVMQKRMGARVEQGEPLAIFHINDETHVEEAKALFLSALTIGDEPPEDKPMIYGIVKA